MRTIAQWSWRGMAAYALLCILGTGQAPTASNFDPMQELAKYNVVWDSPSRDHFGSMPIGNGDIGLNVWWEENGDLLFYIGKTDSWEDNSRLAKVGRVRVRLNPRPPAAGKSFRQTLSLADATIRFMLGEDQEAVTVNVWVDANHPVIHIAANSNEPVEVTASIELWRTKREELPASEVGDPCHEPGKPGNNHQPVFVEPDTVLREQVGRIGWYHHNIKSVGPALSAKLQDMEGFPQPDPILHRMFGAVIKAEKGERLDDRTLRSPRASAHRLSVYVLTRQPALPEQWLGAMDETIAGVERRGFAARRQEHERWWQEFWNRSWVYVSEQKRDVGEPAFAVTRGYTLQRFINACAGRGAYPIKFNGSIFTVPDPGGPGDADYRRWGAGYWWQNTRLPYIGACSAGDFDLMQPLFRMYCGDVLEMAKYRTRHHLGHGGAFLNECSYFWGAAFNESYGWRRPSNPPAGINESGWHRWEFTAGYELTHMMLDYYEHTLDEPFLKKTLLPFAQEILTFYDLHYKTDERGRISIHPAQALETWWDCANPLPDIAGLTAVTERLLALPEHLATAEQRALWKRLHDKMPDLPVREVNGKRMLAPAEKFAKKQNIENPELYAVFPFRQIAVGRPNIDLGIEALRHRQDRGNFGWRQDDIFMAYLGLAEEAREYLVGRARNKHKESRFPAFWGPNYDWVPDQDHGGVLMKALQSMLLQTEGKQIYLLPAWPKDWNVNFKLRAPYRTVVEGQVENGKLVRMEVLPADRKANVTVMFR